VAGAFGGLLAYGIAQLHGALGLRAWQWIFILEGLPTIICALLAFVVLPDFPETSTFLSPAEKALCVQRLKADAGPATETEFSWQQFWAAFRDWKVYGHMCVGLLHSVAFASLGLFVPSITLGFGFE
jgi:MFS family permease